MTTNPPQMPLTPPTPAAQPMLKSDARRHGRWGWTIVLAGLGGFVLWALLAPLDQGVPVTGTVMVTGNKKAVQHLSGGTVQAILVREGDRVRAGQPLVRMNDVQTTANAAITRVKYHTARGMEARLLAERDARQAIEFADDTLAAREQPRVASLIAVQQQLFASRRQSLQAELSALGESIGGIEAFNAGLKEAHQGKREQQRILKEQLDAMRELSRDGFVPRNRLLELERTAVQLATSMSEDLGNIARSQRQIGEIRLRRLQRQQEFQMEVRTQLAEIQKEVDALANQLEGLDYELANAQVRSPADGIVADVSVFTEGGVVAAGFRMMDIVPSSEPLVVQAQVPVHLIDSVHADLPVELIFSSFNQNTTPRIPGIVTQVSPDRLVDAQTGEPYFRLYATITPEGLQQLGKLPVRPGMPVDLFVKTGERTLANYLLRPVHDNFKMAMREE